MTEKRADHGAKRTRWTDDEHLYVEQVVLDALKRDIRKIDWIPHLKFLPGHSYTSIIARACDIRNAARVAGVEGTLKEVAEENRVRQAINNERSIESHRRNTSTSMLRFEAEVRARVADLGVTAGLLGDPARGRSALDRKKAGIIDPPVRLFGQDRSIKKPTLATEPLKVWGLQTASQRRKSSVRQHPPSPRLRRTGAASPKQESLARMTDCPEVACE